MCGIIGYVGEAHAAPILLEGLGRLAYRGYDSSGIAVLDGSRLIVEKRTGKLTVLESALAGALPAGNTGIGHTRWATHGGATDANAHPHTDCCGDIAVIHNGIIENFAVLRMELHALGHDFVSETDTEVLPHLIEAYLAQGMSLLEAVRQTASRIEGAAAIVVLARSEPHSLIAVRISNAGAVVVGYGDGEMLLASDLPPLLNRTRRVVFLRDGEIVKIDRTTATYIDLAGKCIDQQPTIVPYNDTRTEKGSYKHFMLKEICEQPTALLDTIRAHTSTDGAGLAPAGTALDAARIAQLRRVLLIGMGTSLHAALIARTYFERLAHLPAEVDNASEFRYRQPLIGPDTLVVSVSQSGETVDTLAAMDEARRCGAAQITICNVEGAQTTRVADGVMLTSCGPEIGVASTKTFTASIVALYMLAAWLGQQRGELSESAAHRAIDDLSVLPSLVARVCDAAQCRNSPYTSLAHKYGCADNMLFLGRGLQYPVALEGALKMKEIGYLHAEGYAAGEIKHGPIALVDRKMPVIVLAPRDQLYDKIISNIQQVQARAGQVLAIGTEGDEELAGLVTDVICVPDSPELLRPIVESVALQLFTYKIAVLRGNDVDQPRNLAKTVTVL